MKATWSTWPCRRPPPGPAREVPEERPWKREVGRTNLLNSLSSLVFCMTPQEVCTYVRPCESSLSVLVRGQWLCPCLLWVGQGACIHAAPGVFLCPCECVCGAHGPVCASACKLTCVCMQGVCMQVCARAGESDTVPFHGRKPQVLFSPLWTIFSVPSSLGSPAKLPPGWRQLGRTRGLLGKG